VVLQSFLIVQLDGFEYLAVLLLWIRSETKTAETMCLEPLSPPQAVMVVLADVNA